MKRPFDPDDRTDQAKASLGCNPAFKAKAVPLPCQVPNPLPADPVRNSTSSAGLVKSVQSPKQIVSTSAVHALPKFVHPVPHQGLAAPPSPRRRPASPLRVLGGLAPPDTRECFISNRVHCSSSRIHYERAVNSWGRSQSLSCGRHACGIKS